jgi:hypothetical protein
MMDRGRPRRGLSLRPPRFLLTVDDGAARYIVRAWLLALGPALALVQVVAVMLPGRGPDFSGISPDFLILYGIFVAPMIETALMALALVLLERVATPAAAVIGSAILWACLHAADSIAQALVVWWPFLVFSTAFVVWRRRSAAVGYLVAVTIHALYNAALFGIGAIASAS